MDSAQVTELTTAFSWGDIFDTFVLFAPYLLGVIGAIVGIGLLYWGIRAIRRMLSKPKI